MDGSFRSWDSGFNKLINKKKKLISSHCSQEKRGRPQLAGKGDRGVAAGRGCRPGAGSEQEPFSGRIKMLTVDKRGAGGD